MASQAEDTPFHLRPTASPLRVGGRIALLAVLCAVLAGGFVASLSAPTAPDAGQVAASKARCGDHAC